MSAASASASSRSSSQPSQFLPSNRQGSAWQWHSHVVEQVGQVMVVMPPTLRVLGGERKPQSDALRSVRPLTVHKRISGHFGSTGDQP